MKKTFYCICMSILHTVNVNSAYCMFQEKTSIEELTLKMSQAILNESSMAMKLRSATAINMSECTVFCKQLKSKSSDEGIKKDAARKLANLFVEHADTEEKRLNIEQLLYPDEKRQSISETAMPDKIAPVVDYASELDDSALKRCQEDCCHVQYDPKTGQYDYHSPVLQLYNRIRDPQASGRRSAIQSLKQIIITCSAAHNILQGKDEEGYSFFDDDDIALRTHRKQDQWSEKLWAVTHWLKTEIESIRTDPLVDGFKFLSAKVRMEGYEPTRMLNASVDKKGQLEFEFVFDGTYLVDRDNESAANLLEIIFSDRESLSNCIANKTSVSEMLDNGKLQFNMVSSPYSVEMQNQFINEMKERLQKNQATLSSGITISEPIHTKTYTFKDGRFY